MYTPGVSTLIDVYSIYYVVPPEPDQIEEESPFQAFLPGILSTYDAFIQIAQLPRNIIELFSNRREIVSHRVVRGAYAVVPLQLDAIEFFLSTFRPSFCIIWSSDKKIAEAVGQILKAHAHPILHATPPDSVDSIFASPIS
jgi:hypothetical protein